MVSFYLQLQILVGGYKFCGLLKELIKELASKIRIFADDMVNKQVAKNVNVQLAFFMRDLFAGMQPQYVFEMVILISYTHLV